MKHLTVVRDGVVILDVDADNVTHCEIAKHSPQELGHEWKFELTVVGIRRP